MAGFGATRARAAARIALAAALGIGALAGPGAAAAAGEASGASERGRCRPPSGYTTVDLGTLGPGYTTAVDLNDAGLVAGRSEATGGMRAVAWQRGRLVDMTPPGSIYGESVGVNERGEVAHSAYDPATGVTTTYLWRNGRNTAVATGTAYQLNERGDVLTGDALWRRTTGGRPRTAEPIVDVPGSEDTLLPQVLGDGGHVAGSIMPYAEPGGGHPTPETGFVWHDGELTIVDPPSVSISHAVDVDPAGRVLFQTFGSPLALWDDGAMVDLGTLGGTHTSGADIGPSGAVVGSSTTASGELHAFLWDDGRMVDLHPVTGTTSYALEANRRHEVVGMLDEGMGSRPVVFACGQVVELGVDARYSYAVGINERGQVLSVGTTVDGDRVFLSTPRGR